MNMDTGITSEVFTIKSETRLIDIFNSIIAKKSDAVFNYIESLNIGTGTKIAVVGTYFTGVGIIKRLSEKYENLLLVDIYPHLEELLYTEIGGNPVYGIQFSSDIDLIYSAEVVIDTTGFGGISADASSKLDVKSFIIEDPVAEDNDELLKNKNNIHERLNAVKSDAKSIIKTTGINTKTSGTMTLAIGILTNLLNRCHERPGVLYSAGEMGFYEEVIFKEKNISKFCELVDAPAFKVSTIKAFNPDELIGAELEKINSKMI